jgi:hypothetical protein
MAMPVGTWHIVTNLRCSTLEITAVDPRGKLTEAIKTNTNPPEIHNISGTWDAAKNELFTYSLNLGPGPIFPPPHTCTGYLFHGPGHQLFQHDPGSMPPAQTNWNLLAEYWSLAPVIRTGGGLGLDEPMARIRSFDT